MTFKLPGYAHDVNASGGLYLESFSLLHSMVFTGYVTKTSCGVCPWKMLLYIATFQNIVLLSMLEDILRWICTRERHFTAYDQG